MTRRAAPGLPLAALAVAVAAAATFKIRSYDLFWHLEAGQWILAHRALPRTDPFRFTATGVPWTDHEWLAQVLLAIAERPWGVIGLGVARSLFVLALAGLVLAALRRMRAPWPEAMLVVFAAVFLARRRFLLQPELATFAGIVCLLVLLEELRHRPRAGPAVAAVLGTALWANAHPGALVAPGLAALYLGGWLLDARARAVAPTPAPPRWLWLVPVGLLGALVATPHGLAIFAVPGRISAALDGLPVTNPEWEPLWRSPQPGFLAALAAAAAIVAWRWRRDRTLDLATLLPAAALAALTIESVRHQGLFFVGAAFALGRPLATDGESRLGRRGPVLAALVCLAATLWCVLPPQRGPLRPRDSMRFGWGLEPDRYPEQAVDALARWPDLGRLYHEDRFGGYLLWRVFPQRQIFLDGRNELDPALLREVTTAWTVAPRWRALLERFAIDGALLHYTARRFRVMAGAGDAAAGTIDDRTRSSLLFPRSDFALVHWDDVAMLFVRRTAGRSAAIAGAEYRFVDPEDRPWTVERATRDSMFRAGAAAELERRLREDPACRRAAALQAELAKLE